MFKIDFNFVFLPIPLGFIKVFRANQFYPKIFIKNNA